MENKIYLAKSNTANPDNLMVVRKLLSQFDVEVVEFKGGNYSHDEMLNCDMLLVLPDLTTYDLSDDMVVVGKGLGSQLEEWYEYNSDNCFIITDTSKLDDCSLQELDYLDELGESDYRNYARAYLYGNNFSLVETLHNNRFVKKTVSNTSSFDNKNMKYILIKK